MSDGCLPKQAEKYRNILVIDKAVSGEIKLMVSQRSVQESRNLMMNKQGGTHINLVLMLSYAILAG